jgi:hypothetical protein
MKVTNWADEIAEDLAERMLAAIRSVPEAEAPMGAVAIPPEEQMAQFARIRTDPAAWTQYAREHDATLEQMIDYDVQMERRYRSQEAGHAEPGGTVVVEPAGGDVRGQGE